MRFQFRRVVPVLLACAFPNCRPSDSVDRVDDARLVAADRDSANWLTYGRTYSEQRFSPLRQISDSTIAQLGLVWSQGLPTTRGLEATPIVIDGAIYTTSSWSVVYAFDASSGRQLWMYDPKVIRSRTRTVCCDVVNRGLALYRGKVFVGTLDGRLISISARTGLPVWEAVTVDQSQPYAITGAPRIAKGRVLIGNAGAVTVADFAGTARVMPASEIPFRYRRSGLEGVVVLEAEVRLRPGDPVTLNEEVERLFAWRQRGTPFNQPCCGSVFKNPDPPAPAGWARPWTAGSLLEAAGLKGTRVGGAEVSTLHANYFVNTGSATAQDVRTLIATARDAVRNEFGVELMTEVKIIGRNGESVNSD